MTCASFSKDGFIFGTAESTVLSCRFVKMLFGKISVHLLSHICLSTSLLDISQFWDMQNPNKTQSILVFLEN